MPKLDQDSGLRQAGLTPLRKSLKLEHIVNHDLPRLIYYDRSLGTAIAGSTIAQEYRQLNRDISSHSGAVRLAWDEHLLMNRIFGVEAVLRRNMVHARKSARQHFKGGIGDLNAYERDWLMYHTMRETQQIRQMELTYAA